MSMPSDPTVYQGRLSDGRTAASMRAAVRCTEASLEIRPEGIAGTALTWPYATLRSGVPLRAGAPDVLLSQKPAGTETLFVADPAFSRSLSMRAGGALAPSRQRLAGLRVGAAFAALVAAIAGSVWYFDLQPMRAVARWMPQPVREQMGRNVVTALMGRMRACETPAGRAALDRLTQRLLAAASSEPLPVRVTMVDWFLPNAFAAPGGQLVITRGLVQSAASSDEVAGVLAHEIGHALELHPEAGLVRSVALSLAGSVFLAGASGGNNPGVWLMSLRYTRESEREADAHAVRILKGSGISTKGFGDFFERIDALYGEKALQRLSPAQRKAREQTMRILTLVSTHPLTKERVDMVRTQPTYAATPALSEDDWRALRQMCGTPPSGSQWQR
jgi:predicted Zn-dependent protease